jgi:hypothetical protein
MAGREGVAPGRRGTGGIVDLQEPGHRLLLEPLPHVALVGSRPGGELDGRGGAQALEPSVEAELIPDVDRAQVHEPQRRVHEPAGERIPPGGRVRRPRLLHGRASSVKGLPPPRNRVEYREGWPREPAGSSRRGRAVCLVSPRPS